MAEKAVSTPQEGNLTKREALPYEGSHDTGALSSEGVEKFPEGSALSEDLGIEPGNDKATSSRSSTISASDDPEKAQPVTVTDEESDPNIVDWDGPDDPANPQNWRGAIKWGQIAVISFLTLLTPLASSMFAPGVPEVMRNFHSKSDEIATFVVSIYLLGFAM